MTTPLLRVARIPIDPAKQAVVMAAYQRYAEAVAGEPDTLLWELAADVEDDGVLWIIAKFADTSAYEHHMASEAMPGVMAVLQDAMIAEPSMHQLAPLAAKGCYG